MLSLYQTQVLSVTNTDWVPNMGKSLYKPQMQIEVEASFQTSKALSLVKHNNQCNLNGSAFDPCYQEELLPMRLLF